LVRHAASANLSGISLTDHDTFAGLDEAAEEARQLGLSFLPGVEISANEPNRSVHILAFGMDRGDSDLADFLAALTSDRVRRAREMVRRFKGLGVPLDYEAVERECGRAAPTRAHVARALLAEGLAPNQEVVFRRWLGRGRPAFVEKMPTPPAKVFERVHAAGGIAVLAHPGRTHGEREIVRWRADGLDGVEVLHPLNRDDVRTRLMSLSERLGLLRSGGSDWHGPSLLQTTIGSQRVPAEWMETIRERVADPGF
jgi:predicted metal-dependent phosphoesterase TrpH